MSSRENAEINIKVIDGNPTTTKAIKRNIDAIGSAATQTGTKVEQMGKKGRIGMDGMAQSAASAATNFQTLGMGMLNLSTSAVQTYTSISNLARAENRAEAATVSLMRTKDLFARKQQQLNLIVESGQTGTVKYRMAVSELATAESDLAQKTGKLAIEQDAVNDVYALFAANIANVVVSTLMTISSLTTILKNIKKADAAATGAQTVASKLNNITNVNGTRILGSKTLGTKLQTIAQNSATLSTRAGTVAMKAFNVAMGPIGIALMGITVLYGIYASTIDKSTTASDDLLDANNNLSTGMSNAAKSANEFSGALGDQNKILLDLPAQLNFTAKGIANINAELGITQVTNMRNWNTEYAKMTNNVAKSVQSFPNPSVKGGKPEEQHGHYGNPTPEINDSTDAQTNTTTGESSYLLNNIGFNNAIPRMSGNMAYADHRVGQADMNSLTMRKYNSAEQNDKRTLEFVKEEIFAASIKGWTIGIETIGNYLFDDEIKVDDVKVANTSVWRDIGTNLTMIGDKWIATYGGYDTIREMKSDKEKMRQDEISKDTYADSLNPARREKFDTIRRAYANADLVFLEDLMGTLNETAAPAGHFVKSSGLLSPVTGSIYGTASYERIKGVLKDPESEAYKEYERVGAIGTMRTLISGIESDPNAAGVMWAQDQVLSGSKVKVFADETSQKGYLTKLALERSAAEYKLLGDKITKAREADELDRLTAIASQFGYDDNGELNVSVDDIKRREKLGGIAGDLLIYGNKTVTDKQMDKLKEYGGIVNIGGNRIYTPPKALDAMKVRERLESGNLESFVGNSGKMIGGITGTTVFDEILRETYMNQMSTQGTITGQGALGGVWDLSKNYGKIYNTKEYNARFKAESLKKKYEDQAQAMSDFIRRSRIENAEADWMANSGLGNRIISAGNVFGVTQQLGMGYRSALPSPTHWQMNGNIGSSAKTFGSDEIANQEMIDAKNQLDTNMASGRPGGIEPFINQYYEQTMAIAARSNARVAAKISSIGIDFNPNLKQGYWGHVLDRKNRPTGHRQWINTAPTPDQQIRTDIQASPEVTLPSANRLQAISESFAVNGNFSDFNNTAITNDAMDSIGITEQKVFDIRFESTRGDRELENRMRHIEQQAASSSGTSPL